MKRFDPPSKKPVFMRSGRGSVTLPAAFDVSLWPDIPRKPNIVVNDAEERINDYAFAQSHAKVVPVEAGLVRIDYEGEGSTRPADRLLRD